jgi:hypothetical protein
MDVIMASWRESTKKQYRTYLTRWKQFCAERHINWANATVEQGIDFLANLFEQELSYSAINTARSALSVILTPKDGTSFGENRLVCRFLKGVFEIKPALPKYKKIWDVGQVLTYVRSLTLNSELSLKQLSHKLAMLLALLTGQRCQIIHKLIIQLMQKLPGKYIFTIGEKLKHTKPGTHQKPIELSSYADRDLCCSTFGRIHSSDDITTNRQLTIVDQFHKTTQSSIKRYGSALDQGSTQRCRHRHKYIFFAQ